MSVQIDIVPLSTSLDMYGEPDPSSAYSLCGHVSITLKPSFTLFEPRKTASVLLSSLELTFEGQSEIVAPTIGYSGLRLCSVSRELVPAEGVELSNEDQDPKEPCRWNIVFNLPIPGWLPQSSRFGIDNVGTRYALYATARVIDLENRSTSWFSTLCSPFRSRQWSIYASKSISVKRYAQPPATEAPPIRPATYFVQNKVPIPKPKDCTSLPIPFEILNKLRILASVPYYIDIKDHKFPLTIRLRTIDLPEIDCRRLHLTEFAVDIVQIDQCSYQPSQQYASRFPIPGESLQPPLTPLRNRHHLSLMCEAGLSPVSPPMDARIEREFSLLPEHEPGVFKLDESDIFLGDDDESPAWYTLDTVIPFAHRGPGQSEDEWAGPSKIRPTGSGPLFSVQHEMRISLSCTYDFPDGQTATDTLTFMVPLRFSHCAPILTPSTIESPATAPRLPSLIPYARTLPVYSQLFYSNGDRKLDPTPLPLYSLRDPESSNQAPSYKEYQVDVDDSSEQSGLLSLLE